MSAKKTNEVRQDDINIRRFLGELIDGRNWILAIVLASTIISAVYSIFSTPIYEANSLVQVEEKQGNALLQSLSQYLPNTGPESAPEVALLQSRLVLGKTVDDENLQVKVEKNYFPIFGRGWSRLIGEKNDIVDVSRLYIHPLENGKTPKLKLTVIDDGNYKIDGYGNTLTGRVGQLLESNGISILIKKITAARGDTFTLSYLTRLEAINNLQSEFTVVPMIAMGVDSGILRLNLTGYNQGKTQDILNRIDQNYLAQNIEREAAQDAKSLDFLNQQLPIVRSKLDNAEDKLNAYRQKKDSVDLNLEARTTLDQIVNVDNQLNELTFREAEVSQLYTKEHPTYKALLEKRQTLDKEKANLNKQVSAMPATQQEVIRLSRDVNSGREIYMQLLNRQQELNVAKSSAIGNVRIIDDAVTEPVPVKPKKMIVILIGLMLGIFVSIGILLIKIFMRQGVESLIQIEDLGVSVIGNIPVSEWLSKKSVRKKSMEESFLAVGNNADIAIEAIRNIRTGLYFKMQVAKNNIISITGATKGAGKTFVSTNLSAVMTQGDKRVLFIDADMRRGYTHKLFGLNNDIGLTEILSGKSPLEKAIKPYSNIAFDVITRGSISTNPSELLLSRRFDELLKWASDNYDVVIIDTPPVLAVTDSTIVAQKAGVNILVARFEVNTIKEIEISINTLEKLGVEINGCVLNGIMKKASSYYNYGYDSYEYSSYNEDMKK